MELIKAIEVDELYRKCGISHNADSEIRKEINKGSLNNVLNADFSIVYGKSISNNFSNMTIER